MKMTVKKSNGRIQLDCKNSSCFFVSSKDKKRPPKFNNNINRPIMYGFVFTNIIVDDNGSAAPTCAGFGISGGPCGTLLAGAGVDTGTGGAVDDTGIIQFVDAGAPASIPFLEGLGILTVLCDF
jgi:hypothetical protein